MSSPEFLPEWFDDQQARRHSLLARRRGGPGLRS